VAAALDERLARDPAGVCLRFGAESITVADLHRRSEALAAGYQELGVGAGDRVAVMVGNTADVVYSWFATARLGAIHVPISIHHRGMSLRHLLDLVEPAVALADGAALANLAGGVPGGSSLRHIVLTDDPPDGGSNPGIAGTSTHRAATVLAAGGTPKPFQARHSDPCTVVFTSGTTGASKAAVLSHRYVLASASVRHFEPDDVCFSPLPLFHLNAMLLTVLGPFMAGASSALDDRFSVSRFWERVRHYGATRASILGSMLVMLWKRPPAPDDADNPLRILTCAPVPAELHEPFERRFGVRIDYGYGLTEANPVLMRHPETPPGASGRPSPLFDVRLVDDDDEDVADGEAGEIVCRPRRPFVMFSEYYRNPAATVAAWRNLWFHTGDLARRLASGDIEFVGRKKDYIRRRGENVSCAEVEAAITSLDGVAEAAVLGVPSEFAEEDVLACVVLEPGAALGPEALLDHCSRHLPFYAVPRYVDVIDELPKNAVGRVTKYVLRERWTQHGAWDREETGYELDRRR
jgi:crotonobetaine/carnitine-CoA ligase